MQSSINYTLGLGVEHFVLTGTGNLIGIGKEKNNQIVGNNGNDILNGGDFGDDILKGDAGNDVLVGHARRDLLNGGTGADVMDGGSGNDTYVVDNLSDQANDSVKLQDDGGVDLVQASVTHTFGLRIENLTLTDTAVINGTGNELNNILTAGAGNDTLNGGNENDIFTGGSGRDQLNGGGGNDRFDYNAVSESPSSTGRDIITGFVGAGTALGDELDLRDIDANVMVSGNQAFTWKASTPGGGPAHSGIPAACDTATSMGMQRRSSRLSSSAARRLWSVGSAPKFCCKNFNSSSRRPYSGRPVLG